MGENGAGKSTLMNCLFGIYRKDAGEIYYNGEKTEISSPMQALKLGIAMVQGLVIVVAVALDVKKYITKK